MTVSLYQRLHEVAKELGWISKRGENKQQNYDYVLAVDVFADARDALNKHGVLWGFSTRDYEVTEVAGKVLHKMTGDYSFTNVDDPSQVVVGTVSGSAVPPGDKGAWVVTTGMLKYALIQQFLLPTGDDPEVDEGPVTVKSTSPETPTATRATTKAPATTPSAGLNDKQIAKLKVTLREQGLAAVESQRYVLNKLVGKHSSKQMSNDDLDKVLTFFATKSDETEALVVEAMAAASA